MRTLNDIENLLTKKLEMNQEEVQGYSEKTAYYESQLSKANEELLVAEKEIEVEDYNNAKNDIWAASNAKELYQKQMDKLKAIPLVSTEEYNQLLKEIKQIADREQEELNQRAELLILEMKELAEESNYTSQQAEELMIKLQRKVYREPQGSIKLPNGNKTWSMDKTYKHQGGTVSGFYNTFIKDSYLGKRIRETKQPIKRWV